MYTFIQNKGVNDMNGYTKVKSIQYFFVKAKNNRQVPQGKIDHTPTPYTQHGRLISPVLESPPLIL